jgi:uncharacterized OB-fold protein
MTKKIPIQEGLFTWPSDNPALLGSRCQQCGIADFPVKNNCMACGSEDVKAEELPRKGKLWSWTIQSFMPKSPYKSDETPETFRPYGVGYVELPGAICVETRLLENTAEQLTIGMDMEVVFETFRHEDGNEIINFAFKGAK